MASVTVYRVTLWAVMVACLGVGIGVGVAGLTVSTPAPFRFRLTDLIAQLHALTPLLLIFALVFGAYHGKARVYWLGLVLVYAVFALAAFLGFWRLLPAVYETPMVWALQAGLPLLTLALLAGHLLSLRRREGP